MILLLVGVASAWDVSIDSPTEGSQYGNQITEITYTISGVDASNLSSICWEDNVSSYCDYSSLQLTDTLDVSSVEEDNSIFLNVTLDNNDSKLANVNFWVDSIYPDITINVPSSPDYFTNYVVPFDVDVDELNPLDEVLFSLYRITSGSSLKWSWAYLLSSGANNIVNSTNPMSSEGLYSFNVSVEDTMGHISQDGVFLYIDMTPPYYSNIVNQSDNVYDVGKDYDFSITWEDALSGVDTVTFTFNGTSYPVTNIGNVYYATVNDYGVDTYEYNWVATDNAGNSNDTGTLEYTIVQAVPELTITGTTPITYPTASNFVGENCPSQISCSMNLANGVFGAGNYTFNYSTPGNQNYTSNWTIKELVVEKNPSECDVLFNTSNLINYSQSFRVWSNCDSSFTLYRNGTAIANDSVQELGAGTYNFTVIRDDQANYSYFYDEELFGVEPISPEAGMSIAGTTPIVYGTASDFEGTETNAGDGNCVYELYANDSSVSNPDNSVYSYGTTTYIYNTSGCENYTAGSITSDLIVTKAPQDAVLDINDTNVSFGEAILVTCNGTLYRDGEDVSVENNTAVVLGGGTYNYTCTLPETANFSEDSESELVTVNKIPSSVKLYLNGNDTNITIEYQAIYLIEGNVSVGEANATLYRNGNLILPPLNRSGMNVSKYDLDVAGTYNISVVHEESQNYTSSVDSLLVTVNPLPKISSGGGGSGCRDKYNCTSWTEWSVCDDGLQYRTCLITETVSCGKGNTTKEIDAGENRTCVPELVVEEVPAEEPVQEEQEEEPIVIPETEETRGLMARMTGGVIGFAKTGTGLITIVTVIALAGAYGFVHYKRKYS